VVLGVCSHGTATCRSEDATGVVVPNASIHAHRHWCRFQGCSKSLQVLIIASPFSTRGHCIVEARNLHIAPRELFKLAIYRVDLFSRACLCLLGFSQALFIGNIEAVREANSASNILICTLSKATVASKATICARAWCATGNLLRGKGEVIFATSCHNHC